jgi:hypothetical protein
LGLSSIDAGVSTSLDGGSSAANRPLGQVKAQHRGRQQRQRKQQERSTEVGDLADEGKATTARETVLRYSAEAPLQSATVDELVVCRGEVLDGQGRQQLPLALGLPAGLLECGGWRPRRGCEGLPRGVEPTVAAKVLSSQVLKLG